MGRFLFLCMGMMLLCCGCTTSSDTERAPVSVSAFAMDSGVADEPQLLPGMTFSLYVEAGGMVELEAGLLRLQPNGSVLLPLIGEINLTGFTLTEASDRLVQMYSVYYVQKPFVRIQLAGDNEGLFPWGYVTVLGRVVRPGRVGLPSTRNLTLVDAIRGANGFASSANLASVRVTRIGKDAAKKQVTINMNKIGEAGETQEDVLLRAGDVVYVPERVF